jgi:hypothetical protein
LTELWLLACGRYRLAFGTSDKVQLASLVAAFVKARLTLPSEA